MIIRSLGRISEMLVTVLAGIVTAAVIIEVFLRYIFGLSLLVTEELSRYLMVWIVFLASALAVRDRAHISINAFVGILPSKLKLLADVLVHCLMIFFSVVLAVQGIKILPEQLNQQTTTLGVSVFWFYLAIVVGALLIIIFSVSNIYQALTGKREKEPQAQAELRIEV